MRFKKAKRLVFVIAITAVLAALLFALRGQFLA
jgi:hypothetical protein